MVGAGEGGRPRAILRCNVMRLYTVTEGVSGHTTNLALFSGPFCLLLLSRVVLLLTRYMCKDRQKGLGDEVNLSRVLTPPHLLYPQSHAVGTDPLLYIN